MAARVIRERFPGTGVLVLSQYVEAGYALDLLAEGSRGSRLPAQGSRLGPGGVRGRSASRRRGRIGPRSGRRQPARRRRRRQHGPLDELTPREREVMALMAEGRSNQAIAERHVRHVACSREARHEHLHQARPSGQHGRSPARPGRARVPPRPVAQRPGAVRATLPHPLESVDGSVMRPDSPARTSA